MHEWVQTVALSLQVLPATSSRRHASLQPWWRALACQKRYEAAIEAILLQLSPRLQFQLAKLIQSQQSHCNPIPLAGLIDWLHLYSTETSQLSSRLAVIDRFCLPRFSALKQTRCHWSLLSTTILGSQADSLSLIAFVYHYSWLSSRLTAL